VTNKVLFSVLAASFLTLGACGSETNEPPGACVDYSAVSGTASFELDVMPLFDQACNSSSCHSGAAAPEGLPLTAVDAAERTALVTLLTSAWAKRANMQFVTAGDPANSFLLLKCEYDKAGIEECATDCSALGCGAPMPSGGAMLTASELDVLRRWIKDGAKDN
jgi:hypothetical protein